MILLSDLTMPTSWLTRVAISSIRAARPSAMRAQYLARSVGDVAAQPGNAALAAATAASTSAGGALGDGPHDLSVVELVTSSVPVPLLGTQAPFDVDGVPDDQIHVSVSLSSPRQRLSHQARPILGSRAVGDRHGQ